MTDARLPVPTGSMRAWRLSRPGRPPIGAAKWAARAPWAILALSILVLIGAAVWPLSAPPVGESVVPPAVPLFTAPRAPVADRQRTLAALTATNIFAADGQPWPIARNTNEAGGDGGAGGPGAPTAPAIPIPVLTTADPIPPDIKPAFDNLKLVGVRAAGSNPPIAMFVRVSDLTTTFQRSAGEEFVDDKFPQAPWRISEIDAVHDRVILERSGKRLSIALYTNEPVPVVVVPPPPAPMPVTPGGRPVHEVVHATEADIIKELRAQGITEQDIAAITERLRTDPQALAKAQAASTGAPASEESGGLSEVFKLMQQASEKKNAPPAGTPAPPVPPPG